MLLADHPKKSVPKGQLPPEATYGKGFIGYEAERKEKMMNFECQEALLEFFFGAPAPTDAELSALCTGALGPFLADGTAVLGTRAQMDACASFVAALTCETLDFDQPNPCDEAIMGTIALGNDCDANEQCTGDAFCDPSGGGDCGTCTQPSVAAASVRLCATVKAVMVAINRRVPSTMSSNARTNSKWSMPPRICSTPSLK